LIFLSIGLEEEQLGEVLTSMSQGVSWSSSMMSTPQTSQQWLSAPCSLICV
jgi:hypothetical protein